MDCAARAGSLKSGMAVAPQKVSPKVCNFSDLPGKLRRVYPAFHSMKAEIGSTPSH